MDRRTSITGAAASVATVACSQVTTSPRTAAVTPTEEHDRFLWFCAACGAQLYEAVRQVADWRADPVSQVYEDFYRTESHRTCGKCGHVTPRPAS